MNKFKLGGKYYRRNGEGPFKVVNIDPDAYTLDAANKDYPMQVEDADGEIFSHYSDGKWALGEDNNWDLMPNGADVDEQDTEQDPTGKDAHEPGAKLDAGKPELVLLLEGFPRALWAVGEIATFGAKKYTANGWLEVEDAQRRYASAELRHILKQHMGEEIDPDSQLLHAAHHAWGALAQLELLLREQE